MEINRMMVRMYSMLGERGAFFTRLTECAEEIDNLALLTADLGVLSGLTKFRDKYPNKFYDIGIAEQNMIGIAGGMAKVGMNVFATTYANFITMRSFEQIRINMGYMQFPVKVVGSGAGMIMSMSGNSHYSLEDIAIMRAIPNITIVSPADAVEAVKVLEAAIDYDKPMYIRLTGGLNAPVVYKEDYDFQIGRAVVLREGTDVAIFTVGTLTANALKAAKALEEKGISAAVINMHTIKPLDTEVLDRFAGTKLWVSLEEHSIKGGLGGAIAEHKATLRNTPPQIFLGLPDAYGKAGSYEWLLEQYGLTAKAIADGIDHAMND